MADYDILGQMSLILRLLESEGWRDLWLATNLSVRTFANLGLSPEATDDIILHACQKEQVVLMTGNRKNEGPTSLEATIQAFNLPTSLPVLTLSDRDRVLKDRPYAHRVVETMLQFLLEIDNVRGTGRLWLP